MLLDRADLISKASSKTEWGPESTPRGRSPGSATHRPVLSATGEVWRATQWPQDQTRGIALPVPLLHPILWPLACPRVWSKPAWFSGFPRNFCHALETSVGHDLKNCWRRGECWPAGQAGRFTCPTSALPSRVTGGEQQIEQTSSACMHSTSMCIINHPTNDAREQQPSLPTKIIDQTLQQPQLQRDSLAPLQR